MTDFNFETINVSIDDRGVGTVILSRPDKHNALNHDLIVETTQAFEILGNDTNVRLVVLTGEGKSFCSGGDINWFSNNLKLSRSERVAEGALLANLLKTINFLPKPVIGRINGSAYGGGVGMISVCDITIGVDSSKFGLTEVRLGFIPATISPHVVRRMGVMNSRRTWLSGALFSAEKAYRYGLLDEVVTEDELDTAIEKEILDHLEAAPNAVADTKRLIDFVSNHGVQDNLIYTADRLADTWEAEEGRIGITKFFNKELPPWRSGEK